MSGKTRFQPTRRAGFTLVEIMIVVGIITLLAVLALPGLLRARKRAQASRVKDDLRLIEAAVDQYAIETQRQPGAVVSRSFHLKRTLRCPMLLTTDSGHHLPHSRISGKQACQPARAAVSLTN
jgi:prepilin-type N-terminal cleavage/methylation domain-containing protein